MPGYPTDFEARLGCLTHRRALREHANITRGTYDFQGELILSKGTHIFEREQKL
jgi:hypothetical protein